MTAKAEPGQDGPPARTWNRFVALLALLPVAALFALCVVLLRSGGGFTPTTWYPVALVCLGIVFASAIGRVDFRPHGRAASLAVGALLAYTAWTFLTVIWAGVPADAWQGANLTLLYALTFLIAATWRLPTGTTRWTVLAFAAAVAVVGLWVVWAAWHGSVDPNSSTLLGGRLAAPTSYPNATAAMFAIAAWPALGVALDASMTAGGRALALATVTALAELSLLCQSRGALFTLPVVVVLFLLLARRRIVAALVMAVVVLAVIIASPRLLAVYDADSAAGRRDALGHAFLVVVLSAAVLGAAGLALPLLDRLPRPGRPVTRALRAALAVVVAGVVVAALVVGSPEARLQSAWKDFRYAGVPSGDSHFSGLGSNRYDFWRVGLTEFRAHPIGGIGVDNFTVPYVAQRRTDEQPLYPHSLVVRALSQTGIVGAVLLLTFLVAAGLAALRGCPAEARATLGGLLTGFGSWVIHGSVDWLWEMPALGMSAFAILGLAVGVGRRPSRPGPIAGGLPHWTRSLLVGFCALLLAAAVSSLALPWLAARYEQAAVERWRTDFPGSLVSLDRAAALNPLSDRPYVLAGAIAGRAGSYSAMRRSFERAVARNPSNWYAQLELAVAASVLRDRPAALAAARDARRLNPREEITRRVLRGIQRGAPLTPGEVDRAFLLESLN